MQAIEIEKNGSAGIHELRTIPFRTLGEGEILVRDHILGTNFYDIYVLHDLYPTSAFSVTVGCEVAGEVVVAHRSISIYPSGTKVAYTAGPGVGSYGQFTKLTVSSVVILPDSISTHAKIIATAGSKEKCAIALLMGTSWAINSSVDNVPANAKDITAGHGVDVIFDGVGRATFDGDLDIIAERSQLISLGNVVRYGYT
ncbi:nadph2:quinone reductase [Fusarium sporotrichioides]|uniref:Nadph2:quinone reductase n=1 Tax=Fusarium sporotrichioides TaxID=5514 RepID=A0A395S0V6_FUSSP|nr:nadph2:quinone reductase [Fusarium sporotrichioides]